MMILHFLCKSNNLHKNFLQLIQIPKFFFPFSKIVEMKTFDIIRKSEYYIFVFYHSKIPFHFNSFLYPERHRFCSFISIFTKNLSAFDGIFCLCAQSDSADHICAIIMFQFQPPSKYCQSF